MKKLRFLIWLMPLIAGTAGLSAQQSYTLKGTVEDQTGEFLIGASVVVKGTSEGVSTDIDGNFAIKVKTGDVLTVSFIGYKTYEFTADGQNNVKVVLQDNIEVLEDVVVIGYGTARKKDLTGAVVQVNPDKIADQNPSSVQDILRGVPGLQIGYDESAKGQGASMNLRGKNSLGTEASPMLVVDGMAFYGELSEINPDDIAQIDILKDASSAAIYGARAAAGVIIITTKKGKEGKPTVSLSANVGIVNKAYYNDVFDTDSWLQHHIDWYKMYYSYGKGENGLYGYYNAKNGKGELRYPAGYFDDPRGLGASERDSWFGASGAEGIAGTAGQGLMDLWGNRLGFFNAPYVLDNFINGKSVDWNDHTFRTGIRQDYNAAISGATERVNYYMSVGYMKNEGSRRGEDYEAFRASMKLHSKITDWLEIGANANFQNRTDGDISVNLNLNDWDNNMLRNSPYGTYRHEDGTLEQFPHSGTNTNGGYNYDFERQYLDLDKGYTALNTIFNIKVNLPAGFTYTFNIAPRYQWFHDRYWMSAERPYASASSQGVNRENTKTFDWNLNNTLLWDRTFNDVHRFTVTLVQEAEEHKYWKDRLEAKNISPTDALGFHYVNGGNKSQSTFSNYDARYTAASYLGRLFYSYDNKYMITGSFRRDGFSGFGENNKWGNFGAVGLGWNISDEKFMESTRSWLDNAKLRVSWGSNGNREYADYRSKIEEVYKSLTNLKLDGSMVYYNNGQSTVVNALTMQTTLGNPDLLWERTNSWNYGLDFSFFNARLTGAVDVYTKSTKDMLMTASLPSFSGFKERLTNLGEVTNKGVEISLNSLNMNLPKFRWTTSVAFSYNQNKIKHLYYNFDENGVEPDDTGRKWFIGHAIGEIWDYKAVGVWQNTPEDIAEAAKYGQVPGDPKILNIYTEDDRLNDDGSVKEYVYNDKDKVFLGQTTPPIYLSMRNDFNFCKNFDFSFSLYSYIGHKSLEGAWMNNDNGSSKIINAMNIPAKEYWTPDNPTNSFCRLQSQGPSSLRGGVGKLVNRSFMRLDNITFGYTVPQEITRRFMVDRIRVTASCNNVFTIHSGEWIYGDPETRDSHLSNRTFNFGVNLTL